MEQIPAESLKNISEEKLLELAKKELLRDVKCASVRAQQFGAHSWAKPQKYMPNKRFLRHMLINASRDNLRTEEKSIRNKSSKMTSPVPILSHKYEYPSHRDKAKRIEQLHKRDSASERDKVRKRQSRWDSFPEQSKVGSSHNSNDKVEKTSSHYSTKKKDSKG